MIENLVTHAGYLLALVPLILIWIYVFFFKYFKNKQRVQLDMLFVGVLAGIASVLLAPKFWHVYWNPPYIFGHKFYFEEFMYGFFYGGLAADFSEILEYSKVSGKYKKIKYAKYCFLLNIFLLSILFYIIKLYHNLNPIYLLCLFMFFYSIVVFTLRFDLLKASLVNAVTFTIFTFTWYLLLLACYPGAFTHFWNYANISNFTILTIPLEELLFAFLLGLTAGPTYEFFRGLRETVSIKLN